MSLNTLNRDKDIQHTKTMHHREKQRAASNNLTSGDIQGKKESILIVEFFRS